MYTRVRAHLCLYIFMHTFQLVKLPLWSMGADACGLCNCPKSLNLALAIDVS